MKIALATVASLALLVAGCASYPGSPQACAGINDATVSYDKATGKLNAGICAGKENENVVLSGKTPDGLEFSYAATGQKSFEGQQSQADLAALIASAISEAAKALKP